MRKLFNILVVEDDNILNKSFCLALRRHGFTAFGASDGLEALEISDHEHIDLVICDIMMPHMNGYELTEAMREAYPNLPILMVTARDSFSDKRLGFLAGTDDYMVKPIDIEEMMLRVNALLRRAQIVHERKLTVGSTVFYYDSLVVKQGEIEEMLPQKEFYLVYLLLSYPAKTFTRDQLMDEIWGPDSESDSRTVDVHINKIRERFKDSNDFEIVTVRGLGYKAVKKT